MALRGEALKVVRRVEALASKGARPDEIARAMAHLSRMGINVAPELSPEARAAVRKARKSTDRAVGADTAEPAVSGDALVKRASQARTDAALREFYFNGRRPVSPNLLTQTVNQAKTPAERASVVLSCAHASEAMLFGVSHRGNWDSLATVPNHTRLDAVRAVIERAGLVPLGAGQAEPTFDLQAAPRNPNVGVLAITTPLIDAGRDKVVLADCRSSRPHLSSRRVTVAATDYFAVDLAALREHVPQYLGTEPGTLSEDAQTMLGLALEERESTLLEPVASVVTISQQISTPRPVVR